MEACRTEEDIMWRYEAPKRIVRATAVQAVLWSTEQTWLGWKISSCAFTLMARAMSRAKSILYTAGARLCACFLQEYSLKFVLHKYRLRFETDLTLSPGDRKQTCSVWLCLNSHAWVLLWLDICFAVSSITRHLFGFCLFFSKPFHWACWWWHPTRGNYSPFYFAITAIIRVGLHSSRNSWDK